ncbi:MAG: hypothetical protein R3F11_09020 [Verrucomicrobiales bacterium]
MHADAKAIDLVNARGFWRREEKVGGLPRNQPAIDPEADQILRRQTEFESRKRLERITNLEELRKKVADYLLKVVDGDLAIISQAAMLEANRGGARKELKFLEGRWRWEDRRIAEFDQNGRFILDGLPQGEWGWADPRSEDGTLLAVSDGKSKKRFYLVRTTKEPVKLRVLGLDQYDRDIDRQMDKVEERVRPPLRPEPSDIEKMINGERAIRCDKNGHVYALIRGNPNWRDAQKMAESWGGHLATITSKEEDDWIKETFFGELRLDEYITLGGYLDSSKKQGPLGFSWVTGEPFQYQGWTGKQKGQIRQPDFSGKIDCIVTGRYNNYEPGWFDHRSSLSNVIGYLVEWD